MKEWFLTYKGETFTTFGTSHLFMLFLYIACVILLLSFQRVIRSNPKLFQRIRWTLFALLIGCEVIYQTWTAIHGVWVYNLPFHLCGVAGLVGAAALLTLNKQLIAIGFFIGLIPAFLALVTPDLLYDFPNFRYFKFFIHHITISLTSMFLAVIAKPGTITLKSMFRTFILLILYAFIIGFIINPWLNANYLFLSHPPEAATPLDWFGSGIWYKINLGIAGLIVFSLQHLAYRWFQQKFFGLKNPIAF